MSQPSTSLRTPPRGSLQNFLRTNSYQINQRRVGGSEDASARQHARRNALLDFATSDSASSSQLSSLASPARNVRRCLFSRSPSPDEGLSKSGRRVVRKQPQPVALLEQWRVQRAAWLMDTDSELSELEEQPPSPALTPPRPKRARTSDKATKTPSRQSSSRQKAGGESSVRKGKGRGRFNREASPAAPPPVAEKTISKRGRPRKAASEGQAKTAKQPRKRTANTPAADASPTRVTRSKRARLANDANHPATGTVESAAEEEAVPEDPCPPPTDSSLSCETLTQPSSLMEAQAQADSECRGDDLPLALEERNEEGKVFVDDEHRERREKEEKRQERVRAAVLLANCEQNDLFLNRLDCDSTEECSDWEAEEVAEMDFDDDFERILQITRERAEKRAAADN